LFDLSLPTNIKAAAAIMVCRWQLFSYYSNGCCFFGIIKYLFFRIAAIAAVFLVLLKQQLLYLHANSSFFCITATVAVYCYY
jgi:hypothetical protein